MNKVMSSFVPTNFLPNSNVINALISTSEDLNFNELSDESKGFIDIQIANAKVDRSKPYKINISFDALDKDNNKKVVKTEIIKTAPNSNNLCRIDYDFTF